MTILITRRVTVKSVFSPKSVRGEWLGKPQECKQCGCIFRLERVDESKIFARHEVIDGGPVGANDIICYFVQCPECNGSVVINQFSFLSPDEYEQSFAAISAGKK